MDEQTENRNLPVLASETRVIEPQPQQSPLAAPAVVATGGLIAGLGAFVLARILRHSVQGPRSVRIGRGRRGAKLDITSSRSFLVDVHVLNNRR